jgi:hypothetical protein
MQFGKFGITLLLCNYLFDDEWCWANKKFKQGITHKTIEIRKKTHRFLPLLTFMRFLSYVMVPFRPRYYRIFNVKFPLHFAGENEFRLTSESSENIHE